MFLQFRFLLASSRTTVINHNIDGQGARPPRFNFFNQFKCFSRVKLWIFVLKVATSGPHLTFYERNATRAGFMISKSARASHSDGKTFFGLYLYLAGRCCKNPQSAGGARAM